MRREVIGFFWGIVVDPPDEGGPLLFGLDADPPVPGAGYLDRWAAGVRGSAGTEEIWTPDEIAMVTTVDAGDFLLGVWVGVGGKPGVEHQGAENLEMKTFRAEELMQ